jgi:hypothetical protein
MLRPAARPGRWRPREARWRRLRVSHLWPSARYRRRWLRTFGRAPAFLQTAAGVVALATLWLAVNGTYQVIRKPTELLFPVSGMFYKMPSETWDAYAPLFRRHATDTISAEFLAALAQVEGSGNPVVRTYWRWSWRSDPFEMYRPASSAVGMYQITDGTFEQAKRYCIHDHVVVREGAWYAWRSCWLNELYFRVVPSHAIELTAAFLDRAVSLTLARHRIHGATRTHKQRLAALIHLCGTGSGDRHLRRGLELASGLRCGDHDARRYIARVEAMTAVFAALAEREQ